MIVKVKIQSLFNTVDSIQNNLINKEIVSERIPNFNTFNLFSHYINNPLIFTDTLIDIYSYAFVKETQEVFLIDFLSDFTFKYNIGFTYNFFIYDLIATFISYEINKLNGINNLTTNLDYNTRVARLLQEIENLYFSYFEYISHSGRVQQKHIKEVFDLGNYDSNISEYEWGQIDYDVNSYLNISRTTPLFNYASYEEPSYTQQFSEDLYVFFSNSNVNEFHIDIDQSYTNLYTTIQIIYEQLLHFFEPLNLYSRVGNFIGKENIQIDFDNFISITKTLKGQKQIAYSEIHNFISNINTEYKQRVFLNLFLDEFFFIKNRIKEKTKLISNISAFTSKLYSIYSYSISTMLSNVLSDLSVLNKETVSSFIENFIVQNFIELLIKQKITEQFVFISQFTSFLILDFNINDFIEDILTFIKITESIQEFVPYIYFNFYTPSKYSLLELERITAGNETLLLLEDGIYKINWNEYNTNTLISLNLAQLQIPNVKRIDKIYYSHTPQEIVVFTEDDSYSFEPQEYFTQMPRGLRGKEMIIALYGMPQVEFINVGLITENRSKK